MSLHKALAAGTALIAALAGVPASAAYFDLRVPGGVGSGEFAFDDSVMQDIGGDIFFSPLTAFTFAFNGSTYSLADATGGPLAWFTGVELTGIQYEALGADHIEFAAGFGAGDMGSFTANFGEPDEIGPIGLTGSDFSRRAEGIPVPGTLACLLAGLGFAATRARRRGSPFALS